MSRWNKSESQASAGPNDYLYANLKIYLVDLESARIIPSRRVRAASTTQEVIAN